MKDKAYDSRGREKKELTQDYRSYADYAFPNNETCHQRCKNAADSVPCTPINDKYKFINWKCVLRKFTACNSIALPGFEIDSSNQAPMIIFNTYMNQFTCSYHGILIHENHHLFGCEGKIYFFLNVNN